MKPAKFDFLEQNVKEMRDKRDVDGLIKALGYEDARVRESAMETLGETGDVRAVEPLIQALKDENRYVRDVAAKALGNLSNEGIRATKSD